MFVAGFIGSPQMNFINATLDKDGDKIVAKFNGFAINVPAEKNVDKKLDEYVGKDVVIGVRPEDIYDDEESLAKYADGVISAKVEVTELMGAEIFLYLACGDNQITARVDPTSQTQAGEEIKIAINTKNLHVFDKETEGCLTN